MSTTEQWEEIEIPQGTYIGWGEVGQTVTGKVVSYSPGGATDFNGAPCPQLVLELTEPTTNYKDKGTVKETIGAGEFATITAGQANLKRNLEAASPTPGDTLRIKYEADYKTGKGTGKSFKVQIARGTGPAPAAEGDLI